MVILKFYVQLLLSRTYFNYEANLRCILEMTFMI